MARIAKLAAILMLVPAFALATDCRHFFVKQAVVAYVAPATLYQAGASLELEAIVKRAVREELRMAQTQSPHAQQQRAQASSSVIVQKCAKCHSAPKPAAGLTLDGFTAIPDTAFRRIMEIVGAAIEVPAEMKALVASMKPEDKGRILEEMIALKPSIVQQPADVPPGFPQVEGDGGLR